MKYSIIFPTRGDSERLKWCLNSLCGFTHDLKNVEVHVAVDNDDNKLKAFKFPHMDFTKHMYDRKPHFGEYYNDLLQFVTGDVVWLWSDENTLITKDWDKIATKKIKRKGWDVWLGQVNDRVCVNGVVQCSGHPLTGDKFSCYPMVSKAAIKALGYIHPHCLRMWGADLYLKMVFENVGRIIDLSDIVVNSKVSDVGNKMDIYREDIAKMIEAGTAKLLDKGRVAYNVGPDITRLRKEMGEVKCYKASHPSLEGLNHFQFFTSNTARLGGYVWDRFLKVFK